MVSNLQRIVDLCKAEVSLTVNSHKANYETIEGYLENLNEEVDKDILSVMIAMDRMVCIQAYPTTPIGFFVIYHYSIDMALAEMLKILMEDKNGSSNS